MPDSKHLNKLRRHRPFSGDGQIQSRLPSADLPQSRIVKAEGGRPDATVHDDRHSSGPLSLEEVLDRILCGDAARVMARLPSGSVACAITSPPYWNMVDYGCQGQLGGGSYAHYRDELKKVWREVARCLQPNGKFALNVPPMPVRKEVSRQAFGKTHTRFLLDLYADLRGDILSSTDLIAYSLYVWEKQTTEKMFGSYPYPPNLYERNYIEFVAVFVRPGAPPKVPAEAKARARLTQAQWLDLTKQIWWMYPENVGRKSGHPAPFPEALPNRLVNMYSFPAVPEVGYRGDVILDPFNGWGTTCVAAKRLGRHYIGVELSPEFCRHAAARVAGTPFAPRVMLASRASTGQAALFRNP